MKLVIPGRLRKKAIKWNHHYLQHPGHTRIEETLRATMTWPGLQDQVRKYTKSYRSCQINKQRKHLYGKFPVKFIIEWCWGALYVDLIRPYMLNDQNGIVIDFMCLTMIDPATGWFEMVELHLMIVEKHTGKIIKTSEIFDQTARLVNQLWFLRYHWPKVITYDNGS